MTLHPSMTKARGVIGLLTLAVLLASGCVQAGESPPAPSETNDRLYVLDAPGGRKTLAVVDTASGMPGQCLPLGVPAPDWSVLYTVEHRGGKTMVRALGLPAGQPVREMTLDGDYVLPSAGLYATPAGVSPNGRWLVLQAGANPHTQDQAGDSHFVVLETTFTQPSKHVILDGTFSFDAISNDGRSLYLIEDQSHQTPGQYRVRLYDVAARKLQAGAIADKSGDSVMRGRYLTSVAAPDGEWLYSLYVMDGAGPFIHALNLEGRFAVCIFLPSDGAGDVARQMFWSLAMSADGRSLYAANGALGLLAEVDTTDFNVRRTAKLEIAQASGDHLFAQLTHWLVPAAEAKRNPVGGAALSPDGETLFVLAEKGLLVIDTDDFSLSDRYLADQELNSVAVSPDGRLYAVVVRYPNESTIVRLDPATGAVDTEIIEATSSLGVLRAESVQPSDPGKSSEAGSDKAAVPANQASVTRMEPESCPVTQPPDPAYVPPAPHSPQPPGKDEFWYGTEALWTALPADGTWRQLLYGDKVFWWREGYVWNEEPHPALTVTGRRLDGPAPAVEASRATNAFAADIGSAMLVGMKLLTSGCWEITGQYGDQALSFVVWVAP